MKTRRKYPWDKLNKRFDFVVVRSEGERLRAHHVSSPAKIYITRRFGPDAVVACTTVPDGVVVMLAYVPDPSNPVTEDTPVARVRDLSDVRAQLDAAPEFDEEHPDPDAMEDLDA